LESAACAVKATRCLPLPVSCEHIKTALTETSLAGRWQKIPGPCEIILDVAHNPAAMNVISKRLEANPCRGKTVAIFGMLQDKDFKQSIEILSPHIDEWICVDLPTDRALKGQELFEKISSLTGKQCYYYDSVAEAMHHLLPNVEAEDRILVTGSFYTVAAALKGI
jgi:dihydrofolate synthase/folylpolyglutamate synthase